MKYYYAIQAIMPNGKKIFCWKKGKYFYFDIPNSEIPALFKTKKEAKQAICNVPEKGAKLSMFKKVIENKSHKIVKVKISELK